MTNFKRPIILTGKTYKQETTACGTLYFTVNVNDDGEPVETFIRLGKVGGCAAAQLEGLSRLISLGLRHEIPLDEIIEELLNIRCSSPTLNPGEEVLSCCDVASKVLKKVKANIAKEKKVEVIIEEKK